MQAKAKEAALSRQQRHGPSSGFSPLSPAGREALPVHLHSIMLGVSKTMLAEEMPVVEPLPPYKAWNYLVSNELAQGVGRQMYYTDEIGIKLACTFDLPCRQCKQQLGPLYIHLQGIVRCLQVHMFAYVQT